ncbi:kinase-like protein [Mytilinidion resinicola]|uniref:Autophagy-related protein 1 n=1 Tax=Mytilinidion resinicola TaxID=574789 RepID=A0A6A6Z745_9PEZI|nr:kinase-like protein [Mytilinidion resinicola]KAF2816876.1 kinase-like protein [Mytilinidion resinicola]
MGPPNQDIINYSAASTPPLTPLSRPHKDSIPTETDDTFSLTDRRTTELLEFPFRTTDYTLDKKNLLGSGLWSDVFLALPIIPKLSTAHSDIEIDVLGTLSPPLTPVKARNTSNSIPSIPQAYAIKLPAMTSAKAVIASEARILSHLSSFSSYSDHIVPFFGLDTRNGALIMSAMPNNLNAFVKNLNTLDATSRTARIVQEFPKLALNLVRGLEWLNTHNVIHADIKPDNILLTKSGMPVFADFSSSILTITSDELGASSTAPVGGGTWDYLCPSILTRDSSTARYPTPSTSTDLYSLAITLLFVVIGHSPLDSAGSNTFRRRDMVKQGTPLAFAFGGDKGNVAEQRCKDLSTTLGWDVVAWLQGGLRKSESRVGVREWRESLERRM